MSAATSSVTNCPSWLLLICGSVAVLLLSMLYNSTRRTFSNLPPGPRNWPVINIEPNLYNSFTKLAKKYGPILYLRLGVQHIVVVSSAEIAEELMKHKDRQFSHRAVPMSRTAGKYCGFEGQMFLFSDNHPELNMERKLILNEFFTPTKLKTYEELRRQEIAVMVEKVFHFVESASKSNEDGSAKCAVTVGIRDMVGIMVRNTMFALVIGERFDKLSSTNHLQVFPEIQDGLIRLAKAPNVADVLPCLTWLDPVGLIKEFKAFGKKQGQFYEKILSDRRKLKQLQREGKNLTDCEVTERNFVDVLLSVQEQSGKLSDDMIKGTLVGVLSGGIDSTAFQTEWIFVEVARHPEVLQKLQAEVDGVVGMDRAVDEKDIQPQNMPYLNAVVTEILRLHPTFPVTFPHGNKKTSTLAGYTIPARTAVLVCIPSIGRDPKVWKSDPLQFNPERFMGDEGGKIKVNGINFNLLPFGSGRRGCPGYTLAWVLLLRVTATLVHAFDWSPPSGLSPKDISAEETGDVFLNPIRKLFLTPKPRVSCNLYQSKAAT